MKELVVIWALSIGVLAALKTILDRSAGRSIGVREFALAAFLPLLATVSPHFFLFAPVALFLLFVIGQTDEQRLRAFFFAVFLLPPIGFDLLAPEPINRLLMLTYSAIACLAALPSAIRLRRRRIWNLPSADILFALFCGLLWFMAIRGTSGTNMLREALQITLVAAIPYYVASRGAAFAQDPHRFALLIVFSGCVLSAVAIFESARHWLIYSSLDSELRNTFTMNPYAGGRGGFLRPIATFEGPTVLSLFLAVSILMFVGLGSQLRGVSGRITVGALLAAGLLATLSRIGLLAVSVGVLAALAFRRSFRLALAAASLLFVGYKLLELLARRSDYLAAVFGFEETAIGTLEYRQTLTQRMIEIVAQHPLLGISRDRIQVELSDMVQGQGIIDLVNAPLSAGLQAGIPGLIIFLLPSLVVLVQLWRMRSHDDPDRRAFAAICFSCLVACNAGLFTTNLQGRNGLMLFLLIGLCSGTVERARAGIRLKRSSAVPIRDGAPIQHAAPHGAVRLPTSQHKVDCGHQAISIDDETIFRPVGN